MRSLGDADILALDEACSGRSGIEAALLVLGRAAALPEATDPAMLPLGERDRLLLELRAVTLGERMDLHAACPACGVALEVPVVLRDLPLPPPTEAGDAARLAIGGRTVVLRPVDSRDLAAAATVPTARDGRRILAARCTVPPEEAPRIDPSALGDDEVEEIGRRLAGLDPAADIAFSLRCPDCGHEWEAGLDVPGIIRTELHRRAQALLDEVDAIARTYHWREADILALSPVRRRDYLARIGR